MTKIYATEAGVMFEDTEQVDSAFVEIYNNPLFKERIKNALKDMGINHMITEKNESVATVIIDTDSKCIDENNLCEIICHLKENHYILRDFVIGCKPKDPLDLFRERLAKKNSNIPVAIVCLDINDLREIIEEYGKSDQGKPDSPTNG